MKSKLMNGIRTCKTRAGLGSIKKPDTELVIWQRSLSSDFQGWINQLDVDNVKDVCILVNLKECLRSIKALVDSFGLMAGSMRNLLVADINDLVIAFAEITQSDEVDVRLQLISGDACWKFHRDNVETRLLTTYRGPTTEWVQKEYAEQAIQKQRKFKGPLESLGDGDVAIFKGSCKNPTTGVVHRSPPIAGTGVTRLTLCLNQRSLF